MITLLLLLFNFVRKWMNFFSSEFKRKMLSSFTVLLFIIQRTLVNIKFSYYWFKLLCISYYLLNESKKTDSFKMGIIFASDMMKENKNLIWRWMERKIKISDVFFFFFNYSQPYKLRSFYIYFPGSQFISSRMVNEINTENCSISSCCSCFL